MLDILDTAGQEELCAMRDQYIRSGQGFLVVYSIQSRISFENVEKFRGQILRVKDEANFFPMVVCGNKCDLPPETREVTTEMGKQYCDSLGLQFFETSAKERINVNEAFIAAVREVRKFKGGDDADVAPVKKRRGFCSLL